MKIAYGTYGMPKQSLQAAVPRLAKMGYHGIELCIADPYPTAPARLGPAERKQTRELLAAHDLELNALMMIANVMGDVALHDRNLEAFAQACTLAHDLQMARPAVITTTVGGRPEPWDSQRGALAERLRAWVALAEREGCVLAVEPHVGAVVDRPERAAWLIAEIGSPALRLNLDISHFDAQDYTMPYTTALLAPLAVHAHVKDARTQGGRVQFLLPGEGDFDYAAYLRALRNAGYDGYLTVEISGMVSGRDGYEPYEAARFSLRTLQAAFAAAGMRY